MVKSVKELLNMKELKALDPTKDDEAIAAEMEVKAMREILKEVNLVDVLLVNIGNYIIIFGMLFLVFSPGFPKEDSPWWFRMIPAVVILVVSFGSPWVFKSTRTLKRISKRYTLASRIAAYGAAFRSPYNLLLDDQNLAEMLRYGKTKAFSSTSNLEYKIAVDSDEGSYAIIYREEDNNE